jgi:ureidoglycolate hydrolase
MVEIHPFTIEIKADPLNATRFRWVVCEGDQIHLRSPQSYATRGEAEIEAAAALKHAEQRHHAK